jgi:hypothetical protein
MMAEGDAFPVDAFFRDAGRAGADPRKGLWHPGVATIATLAHADPLDAWWTLAALLAPLFALNAAAFAFLIGGPLAAAIAAWALVFTYGGTLASQYLREAVFATKLADQLALATITAVVADLDGRRTVTRLAAVGLALGAVAAHVFAAIEFGVVFGSLGVGLLVTERGFGSRARRLAVTASALGLACLPYLLWRAHGAYAPNNVIHTEPQGLLQLAPGVTVISVGVLWDWFGKLWVVFPLSLVAWARNASRTPVLLLLTTTLAVTLLMFCPPVVALLQPRIGYLLMRFVWLLWLPAALAFAIPALLAAVRTGGVPGRAAAVVALLGLAALFAPVISDAAHVLASPAAARARDMDESVLRWRGALSWMDSHLPEGTVVLSDPATSYSVPMMTRHWVSTLVDQHSSPNDSLALTRILDARDALDPGAGWERTRDVLRRWGVTAIALNNRFSERPRLDYWAPTPDWFARSRARFDAEPGAFVRVYDTRDFVVYQVVPAALDSLHGVAFPRAGVRPWRPGSDPAPRAVAPGEPELLAMRLGAASVRPGEVVPVAIDWRAPRALPVGHYTVAVRFDRDLPAGFTPPAWCAKPARKVLEKLRHERYRFRDDHLPAGGDFGVDLWRPSMVVTDSFRVAVPADMAPGDYRIQVLMLREPHYPNFRLADYFLDHDYYTGLPVGTLRVSRAGAR